MSDLATERIFQDDIIRQLQANGWLLGTADKYNRELALYPEDEPGFVQETRAANVGVTSTYPNLSKQT